jgi:hypothetical protein
LAPKAARLTNLAADSPTYDTGESFSTFSSSGMPLGDDLVHEPERPGVSADMK